VHESVFTGQRKMSMDTLDEAFWEVLFEISKFSPEMAQGTRNSS
jgi:hypothetical protein